MQDLFSDALQRYLHLRAPPKARCRRVAATADIEMDEGILLKAVVEGAGATFHVDDMDASALVVPHLFQGADARCVIGLFVDNGTEGNFRNHHVACANYTHDAWLGNTTLRSLALTLCLENAPVHP